MAIVGVFFRAYTATRCSTVPAVIMSKARAVINGREQEVEEIL